MDGGDGSGFKWSEWSRSFEGINLTVTVLGTTVEVSYVGETKLWWTGSALGRMKTAGDFRKLYAVGIWAVVVIVIGYAVVVLKVTGDGVDVGVYTFVTVDTGLWDTRIPESDLWFFAVFIASWKL